MYQLWNKTLAGFVLVMLLLTCLFNAPTTLAVEKTQFFPETGHTVYGKFLEYWESNGGLPVYGYPITDSQMEVDPETNKTFLTQWFERNRFELHPENAGTKFEVLLGLLGKDLNRARLNTDQNFTKAQAIPGNDYFSETGHNLGSRFKDYWYGNGGLERFGYPISEEFRDTDPETGQVFLLQWFERARYEFHPENKPPYDVLLGLLGKQLQAEKEKSSPYWLEQRQPLPDLPTNAQRGGSLTSINIGSLSSTLHPYPSNATYSSAWDDVASLIWGAPLVRFNYDSLKFELDAAQAVRASQDRKVLTFTLRNDLKWSDGIPITGADYQFGFDNARLEDLQNPDNNYVYLSDFEHVVGVKANGNSLEVTFDQAYAPTVAYDYIEFTVKAIPAHIWQGRPFFDPTSNPEITKPTVVSGPYTIESWDPVTQGELKVNSSWYRGKANFERIIMKVGDVTQLVNEVKSGQADWAYRVPLNYYPQLKQNPALKVIDWEAINGDYRFIDYNLSHGPLAEKNFRQALNYAIDRDVLMTQADDGLAAPRYSILSSLNPFVNPEVNRYSYNLEKAKDLLAKAGYKLSGGTLLDKTNRPVELTVLFPTSSNPRKLLANYLQEHLKKLGIKINIDGLDFNAYSNKLANRNYDISLSTVGGGSIDPYFHTTAFLPNSWDNNTGYSNDRVTELYRQAISETDQAKRKAIYNELQQIVIEDAPVYPLWGVKGFNIFSPRVQGVTPSKASLLNTNDAITRWYFSGPDA